MMKRIATLLLAFLLPLSVLAESYMLEMEITSVNADAYVKAMNALLDSAQATEELAGVNPEAIFRTMAEIAAGMGVRMQFQTDPMMVGMEMEMKDSPLADVQLFLEDGQILLTSSLIPKYGFSFIEEEADLSGTILNAASDFDFNALQGGIQQALAAFAARVPIVQDVGSFSGDAYQDGELCYTISLDDEDMAAIAQAFLTEAVTAELKELGQSLGLDMEALLTDFATESERVAEENAYAYILRYVTDRQANPVGASLTVLHLNEQIATASLGMEEKAAALVVGLGMNQENYWHAQEITWDVKDDVITLNGTVQEFTAAKTDAYAYARTAPSVVYVDSTWSATIAPDDEGVRFTADFMIPVTVTVGDMTMAPSNEHTVLEGRVQYAPFSVDCTMHQFIDDQEVLAASYRFAPCDPVSMPSAGEIILLQPDSDDPAMLDLIDEVTTTMINKMMVRMLKLLPLDMILSIPQLIQVP